jgi:PAS domain S-box-containing protein
MQSSSRDVAEALQPSVHRMIVDAGRVAALAAITRLADARVSSDDMRRASLALQEERQHVTQILSIGIWSKDSLLVFDGPPTIARLGVPLASSSAGGGVAAAQVGPLRMVNDTLTYGTTAPVRGHDSSVAISVVITRRLGQGAENRLTARLIDQHASLLLGNASGDLWTDFSSRRTGPPLVRRSDSSFQFRDVNGRDWLGALTPVRAAPWLIMVEMPRDAAVGIARGFLLDMLIIGAVIIVLGGIGSWLIARGIARPLAEVTRAAEDLAEGDYGRRVGNGGRDEVGRLATSFNVMAEKVASSTRELAQRAETLEDTNRDLRESELRYRSLVQHSPDGIVVHRDLHILFGNTAAERILGEGESIVGREVTDFLQTDDRRVVHDRMRLVQELGVSTPRLDLQLVRTDGRLVDVECVGLPLEVDGMPAVQSILHDVTERKHLEEQVRQSQKMEAVGRLAGGIAHDFNNLLTVIRSYSEFALEGYENDDPRRTDIEEVRRAAEAAAQLTRQLLTFSRKEVLSPQYVDLNESITGTLAMLRRLIGERIQLVTELGSSLPGIWTDPGQLQQVLLNLAVNARDAMPEGGVLRIRTGVARAPVTGAAASEIPVATGDYVTLMVEDSGIGMTPDVSAKIFEPFFTTKQTGRGTGLGLSSVYGIIQRSNGHVRVTSELGRGTQFEILFPAQLKPLARSVPPAIGEQREPVVSARVLLVDDDSAVRRALCRALTNSRMSVVEAADASTALDLLEVDPVPVDLVITDMVMPGKSGLDLIREIRLLRPDMPAIIMSGYSEEATGEGWRLPANAVFMEKPIAPRDLVREARQILTQPVS